MRVRVHVVRARKLHSHTHGWVSTHVSDHPRRGQTSPDAYTEPTCFMPIVTPSEAVRTSSASSQCQASSMPFAHKHTHEHTHTHTHTHTFTAFSRNPCAAIAALTTNNQNKAHSCPSCLDILCTIKIVACLVLPLLRLSSQRRGPKQYPNKRTKTIPRQEDQNNTQTRGPKQYPNKRTKTIPKQEDQNNTHRRHSPPAIANPYHAWLKSQTVTQNKTQAQNGPAGAGPVPSRAVCAVLFIHQVDRPLRFLAHREYLGSVCRPNALDVWGGGWWRGLFGLCGDRVHGMGCVCVCVSVCVSECVCV
jgi:hypothetical protein